MIITFKVFHRLKTVQQAQKGAKKAKNAHQKSPNRKKRSHKEKMTMRQRFAFSKFTPVFFYVLECFSFLFFTLHHRKPVPCSGCVFILKSGSISQIILQL